MNSCKNADGKSVKDYQFDEATNNLADPKLTNLMETHIIYENFLKRNLNDVGFTDGLNAKHENDEESAALNDEIVPNPRKLPSEKQKKMLKEMKFAEARKKEHDELVARIDKLVAHIQQKMEKLKLQVKKHKRKLYVLINFLNSPTVPAIRTRLVLLLPPHGVSR